MAAPVMPLLVLNMGSEMVFVLDHQLCAKKTPHHTRRLQELRALLCALHDRTFITALFQQTPTLQRQPSAFAMRALFGRLANAPPSLCVNARTMDILYDAICTGFKRQLLACSTDNDALLGVTLNHLDATKRMVETDAHVDEGGCIADVESLVDETILWTHEAYSELRAGDCFLLKQSLCHFLQDLSRKQRSWASPHAERKRTASDDEIPTIRRTATVRYYGDGGKEVVDQESFLLASIPPTASTRDRYPYSTLGGRHAHEDRGATQSIASIVADAKRRNFATRDRKDQEKCSSSSPSRQFKASASDALDLLADLLGATSPYKGSGDDAATSTWKWTLFDEAKDDKEDEDVPTLWIDAQRDCKEMDALRDEWDAVAQSKGVTNDANDEESDLLRLLDSA